ncbi:hypothetical protein evm_011230, partial [Chilo suppressalis]
TIKKDVVILGRVKQVQETKITVCLPGNMTGTVMACHVSEAYNKLLEAYVNDEVEKIKELPEMFRPGQYVIVKVLEVDGTKLMLSMMPQHISSGRVHTDLQKGDLLQAAVSSVEDHGFVMDIGIANTRPFLPKKNTNPEIELEAGSLTWCCVKSLTPSPESCILSLSNELSALQNAAPRRKPTHLTPATPVFFTVDKPLDNGIEGHVFDETTAYIQRQHVDKVKGKKPALGQKVKARVLYVMPTRNTPFLTMKDIFETACPELEAEQTLKEGEIIDDAKVVRILGRTVNFRLGRGCVGSMSLSHVAVHEDLEDEQVVANSYPIGSTHRVRVVAYNPCDFLYLVSDRTEVINEKYFSLSEMQVGQLVDATVKAVTDNHLLVDVGRVTGYIPRNQFSDAGIFVDPKKASTSKLTKKFKVGQSLKARVLVLDRAKNSLILTLKPSLLTEDLEVLSSYEQAQIGKAYTGFIRFVRDYVLVTFFDNVTAYVPRSYVTKEPIESLHASFHLGQIVNCTILRVDVENKKMNGSLTTTPFWPASKREKTGKRKHDTDTNEELPNKKQKQTEVEEESNNRKKKKQTTEQVELKELDTSEECMNENEGQKKRKRKKSKSFDEKLDNIEPEIEQGKKKNKKKDVKEQMESEEKHKASEESDAIETDIYEDSDHVLAPQDLFLIDLSDCDDAHKCKRRIVSLTKNINARARRIDKINEKIVRIENVGLSAKNKKYHTAMHTEKLVTEERIKKLLEALKNAQEKLKGLGYEGEDSKKEKKIKKKSEDADVKEEIKEEEEPDKRNVKDSKERKEKKSKIKVVENLEPVLEVPSAKDFWSVNTDESTKKTQEENSSSSDEEEKEQPKKKRKKLTVAEKLAKARQEEEHVRSLERRAIESDAQPRSSDQFERALLASPDASQLWIAYMAFHLQATEIDKARAVARRALNTISFREEDEKLNVWLALLHLEHRFGTKESQQKTLEEALQTNEPYKVHSKLLDILVDTGKAQELNSLVELMMKKYRRDCSMYPLCGSACFKLGLVDKARSVMQKALTALEKKEHVSVLVQFALLERSLGERERSEALFEQILAVYPQRVDVCAVYVDMMLKAGEYDHIRQVMERITSQKLPARKMKILYKKWVEVEEKIGDQEKVEEIRQRALEYIEKAKF